MSDSTTEQGLHVYAIGPDWVLARTPDEALEHEAGLGGGETLEELREDYGTPAPIDLDANGMFPDPYESMQYKITYREAIRRHLGGKYPEVPVVIATTEW